MENLPIQINMLTSERRWNKLLEIQSADMENLYCICFHVNITELLPVAFVV